MSLHHSQAFPPLVTRFPSYFLSPSLFFHEVLWYLYVKLTSLALSYVFFPLTLFSFFHSHISLYMGNSLYCGLTGSQNPRSERSHIMQLLCPNDAVLSRVVVMPNSSQPWLTWLYMHMHIRLRLYTHLSVYLCCAVGEWKGEGVEFILRWTPLSGLN